MATEICETFSRETRQLLMRCVDPTDELLIQLSDDRRLRDDIKSVKTMTTIGLKTSLLLGILCSVPEQNRASVLKLFEGALCDTNQNHVADLLRGVTTTIMSQEHHDLLTKQMYNLRKFINAKSELVDILLSEGVFSCHDADTVASQETDDDMAATIVKILQRKPDSSFDKFIEALNKSGQDHVSFILTGVGSHPLKDVFITHLNNSRGFIVNHMNSKTGPLVSYLVSAGVLTDSDKQRVMARDTNDRRNELILDILLRKSQRAYDEFTKTLRTCDQEHLVDILEGHEFDTKVDLEVDEESIDGTISAEENLESLENELRSNLNNSLVEYQDGLANSGSDNQECDSVIEPLSQLFMSNGVVVQSVNVGSIHIRFRCLSLEAFENFRRLHDKGILNTKFTDEYCPLYTDRGLKKIKLVVSTEQLDRCSDEFHRDLDTLMTAEHRQILQMASESKAVIDTTNVSDELLDGLQLFKHTKVSIREMNDRREKVRTLFDVVSRRPDVVYDQLITALKATGQHEVARLVINPQQQRMYTFENLHGEAMYKELELEPERHELMNMQLRLEKPKMAEKQHVPAFEKTSTTSSMEETRPYSDTSSEMSPFNVHDIPKA